MPTSRAIKRRGTVLRDKTFKRSVIFLARLRNDRPHSWKQHFRGVYREVIGYYEMQARKDRTGENFVYATIDAVMTGINQRGKKYSKAAVVLAHELFRHYRILSGIVERYRLNAVGDQQLFQGRIVTPHYALCETVINGKFCQFQPMPDYFPQPGNRFRKTISTRNVGRDDERFVIWWAGQPKRQK